MIPETNVRVSSLARLSPLFCAMALTLAGGAGTSPLVHSAALPLYSSTLIGASVLVTQAPERARAGTPASLNFVPPDADGRAVYTVVLKEPAVASYTGGVAGFAPIPRVSRNGRQPRPDMTSAAAEAYARHLEARQTQFTGALASSFGRAVSAEHSFQHALNAVMLRLTPAEAAELAQRPDVLLVARERQRELRTYDTPAFIGAGALWNDASAPGGSGYKGQGMVVGVIDTGINYLSNSVKATGDDSYSVVNPLGSGVFLGRCAPGGLDAGRCNNKLIGMYNTVANLSGRDLDGHGSHTSSTAAGGFVNNAGFAGGTFQVAGVAPHANIISYAACTTACSDSTLIPAINQAVANNIVDVINYSIGGPNAGPWLDAIDQAFLGAHDAGIFIATAAGNDGPNAVTTDSYAPWYASVAASTPRGLPGFILTATGWSGSATVVPGSSPFPATAYSGRPLVESPGFANGSTDGCSAYAANYFRRPQTAGGTQAIAVIHLDQNNSSCGSIARRSNAVNAGAIATVFVDPEYINLGAANSSYSMLMASWNALKSAVGNVTAAGTATSSISFPIGAGTRTPDVVAGFSSRGPTAFGTLKPDVAAPGDTVLAAVSPTAATGYNDATTARNLYATLSGTSMASPHVAGAATLVRQVRPTWTPMEVKSALMSTAQPMLTLGNGSPSDANQHGAGRIDPALAASAGLVLNETGSNFQSANPGSGGSPAALNLASYFHADCVGSCVFTRTVRSTGRAATWSLSAVGLPAGSVGLSTNSFALGATGSTSFSLTVNSSAMTLGQWHYGAVILTPSDPAIPTARFPIAVRPATAKLGVDKTIITASLPAGTSTTTTLEIRNSGNPLLQWSIPTTTLKGPVMSRRVGGSQNGGIDRTVVTNATAIDSTSTSNAYGADWFDIDANGSTLAELTMYGFGYNGSAFPPVETIAAQFAFRVWGDNAGQPNGRPGNTATGDQNPVFQWPAAAGGGPVNAAGISLSGDAVTLDLAAAGVSSAALPRGRYWLNFAPSFVGTTNQFYLLMAEMPGKTPAGQFASPNATGPATNKAWRATSSQFGASYTGYAMDVVVNAVCSAPWLSYNVTSGSLGLDGSQLVQVTMNASGLAAGIYSTYLCVSGNGTSPPSFLGGQDSFLIPVKLTVTAGGNQAPTTVGSIAGRTDAEGAAVTQATAANFSDPDGDTLGYAATGLPAGLSISPSTGVISGTLSFTANAGSPYSVVVTAADPSGAFATQAFTWTVTNVNRAPTAVGSITSRTDAEGVAVTQPTAANFSDLDGDTLGYAATGLPAGLSISPSTGVISGTLSFTANAGSPYSVVVTAADPSGAFATQPFTWTVTNVNRPPTTVGSIADQTSVVGQPFQLAAGPAFSDPDGDGLTFSASGLPASLVISPVTGTISGTPTNAEVGTYAVTITATDQDGASAALAFGLAVRDSVIFGDGFEPAIP